jgi:hypothetical protein
MRFKKIHFLCSQVHPSFSLLRIIWFAGREGVGQQGQWDAVGIGIDPELQKFSDTDIIPA